MFELTDEVGRIVYRDYAQEKNYSITMEGWKPGIYFLKISGDGKTAVHKILKN
jgi:hypothetical protein